MNIDELVEEILKRLPVKKLVQLQCVCKSWKYMISSPDFVRMITTAGSSTDSGGCCRLKLTDKIVKEGGRNKLVVECSLQDRDSNRFTPLGFPDIPNYHIDPHWIPGHLVDGVIFIRYTHNEDHTNYLLCVWNPFIRKQLILPWPNLPTPYGILVGAWFDAEKNYLKVLRSQLDGSYDVLSVRDGVWKMNLKFPKSCLIRPDSIACGLMGLFLNGSLYWILASAAEENDFENTYGHYDLLHFDCKTEKFQVMDLTRVLKGSKDLPILFLLDLGPNNGTMLALAKVLADGYELWLMQPGSSSSWIKLDLNHLEFAAAAAHVITPCGTCKLSQMHNPPFRYTFSEHENIHRFQESMMLMDIGKPSSSKLHN